MKACSDCGLELRFALSPERDKYLQHHRTFGGAAWIWLMDPPDGPEAARLIEALEGVEEVISRDEAARRFRLMPERIGDPVVLGDKDTVFGETDAATELLEPTYRSHGSLHESDVPLVIFDPLGKVPTSADMFALNADLARFIAIP